MAEWVNAEERLPKNQARIAGNRYHLIKYQYIMSDAEEYDFKIENRYSDRDIVPECALSFERAMYMNGEWWVSYHAKLMYPVKFWLEDDSDT